MSGVDTSRSVYQLTQLIPRVAIDDLALKAVDLVRTDCERQMTAAVGDAPIIEERETRRYYDRDHRPCTKTDAWASMEFRITWYLERPPAEVATP